MFTSINVAWQRRQTWKRLAEQGMAMPWKATQSVPFRSFRALINLNNFVLRQVTHNGKRWNSSDISSEKVQASISIHNFLPYDRSDAGIIQLRNWAPILDWLGGDQRPKHHKRLLFTRDRTTSSSLWSTPHSIMNSLEINKNAITTGITKSGGLELYLVFVDVSSKNCLCNTTLMENKKY